MSEEFQARLRLTNVLIGLVSVAMCVCVRVSPAYRVPGVYSKAAGVRHACDVTL